LYLFDAGKVEPAIALWERAIEDGNNDLAVSGALERLGDAYQRIGDSQKAEETYRTLIARMAAQGRAWGSSGLAGVFLAEVLLAKGTPSAVEEAGELLRAAASIPHLQLSSAFFLRYLVTRATWAHLSGEEIAKPWATEALALADDGRAPFLKDEGAFPQAAETMLETARRLAG
jgi:tetratricopeptide (TPR) repeat protein